MTTQNFLVEIGTEELPPKALKTLATSFADNVEAELNQAGLTFDKIEWFAAPRRLAVKVLNLATQQPSKEIEKRGPAVPLRYQPEATTSEIALFISSSCIAVMRLSDKYSIIRLIFSIRKCRNKRRVHQILPSDE